MGKYTMWPERLHKTFGGVWWNFDSALSLAKIIACLSSEDWLQKHGNLNNYRSYAQQEEMQEKIFHLVEGVEEAFEESSTHLGDKNSKGPLFGQVITSRADFRNRINKGRVKVVNGVILNPKLNFFRNTLGWNLFYSLAVKAHRNNEVITTLKRYEAHETANLLQAADSSGVYVNIDPEHTERFYLGKAQSVQNRHKGHMNSHYCCVRAYLTINSKVAGILEQSLFDQIQSLVVWKKEQNRQVGTCGAMAFEKGTHAIKLLDQIVNKHYKRMARMTGTFEICS